MTDNLYINVAGVSFRQDNVANVVINDECQLVPEPSNPYDKFAIGVVAIRTHGHLGYIPRDANQVVHEAIAAGAIIKAIINSVGEAGQSHNLGVQLHLEVIWPGK